MASTDQLSPEEIQRLFDDAAAQQSQTAATDVAAAEATNATEIAATTAGPMIMDGEFTSRKDVVEWTPFIITTEQRLRFYGKGRGTQARAGAVWSHDEWRECKQAIHLTINPSQMDISQGLRVADSKTKTGTVQYHWQDPIRKTFFDEPKVTFAFQAGNILPTSYMEFTGGRPLASPPMPSGLSDFYEFMGLLDEDRITIDGRPNYVHVMANSRVFPRITFIGFFDPDQVSIPQHAEDPNKLEWTATMTCRATYPRLYNSAELKAMFRAWPVSR